MNRTFHKISFYAYDRFTTNYRDYIEKKELERFKKKYLSGSRLVYKSFFNSGCLDTFFFYQENGYYYEFFSGYCLGQLKGNIISGELALDINISDKYSNALVYQLSDSQFAFDVNPYLKDKKYIAESMQKYFELLHSAWIASEHRKDQTQRQRDMRDFYNTSSINQIIDERAK